jgi:hypothetical protein
MCKAALSMFSTNSPHNAGQTENGASPVKVREQQNENIPDAQMYAVTPREQSAHERELLPMPYLNTFKIQASR